MKLSIHIVSIKDCKFKALVYVKYPTIPDLGIKNPFRSSPSIAVNTTAEGIYQSVLLIIN